MRKKHILSIVILLIFFIGFNNVKADTACTVEVAEQIAKIVFHETGFGNFIGDEDEYFFVELATAGVVLNNTAAKDGDSWYEKIYNLTDNNYAGYSKYKDKTFNDSVSSSRQNELLYISELVLTGKFNLPKNLYGQASCACLLGTNSCQGIDEELKEKNCQGSESWAQEWTHSDAKSANAFDIYFGYSKYQQLATTDVFGNTLNNTSPSYYRTLAKKLRLSNYSYYTSSTVCDGLSISEEKENEIEEEEEEIIILEPCENPDILKIIYFVDIIVDIIKVIIPIGLIIMGTMDFSKSITVNDEEIQKKVIITFAKRIFSAVIIFAAPWIVEVVLSFLGNLTDGINFKECFENANKETIQELEAELEEQKNNN